MPIGLPQISEAKPVKKEEGGPKFEHEDWCNSCRDGGELVMCYRCPRGNVSRHTAFYVFLTGLGAVFHPGCYGFSKAHVARTPLMTCSQHKCHSCLRTTGDAGGMLFRYFFLCVNASERFVDPRRCQTCPQAFCEDCLPEDDIDAIGDTLPELSVASVTHFQPLD